MAAPSNPGSPNRLQPPLSEMDCPKTESGELAVASLPDDSIVDILSRLQAKPLFRFKCVSKGWCGLITDRLGFRKLPQTLEGFFARGRSVKKCDAFIDLSGRPVPLVEPSFSFLTKLPEIKKIVLLGSCNGLVLFGHRQVSDRCESLGYIVCNPATEEWVSVPSSGYTPLWGDSDDPSFEEYVQETCLIFDPAISPHFQLIEIRMPSIELEEVCTFSSVTGAWRFEDITRLAVPGHTVVRVICPFDGMLYMCAHQRHLPKDKQDMILAVGGEGRPFRSLHWPKKDRGDLVFLGQSQGHLHALSLCMTDVSQMNELSIWVLEDDNAEKWVLRDNLSFSRLFGRKCSGFYEPWKWYVVSIHPDRGLVFFAEYWNCKLIAYDMDKKEVYSVCSLRGYRRSIIPYVPYFAESVALAKKY